MLCRAPPSQHLGQTQPLQRSSLDSKGAASLPWTRDGSPITKLLLSVPGNRLPTGTTSLRLLAALVVDFPLETLPVAGLAGLTSLAVVSASALELPPELAALTNLRQLILEVRQGEGRPGQREERKGEWVHVCDWG